MRILILSTCYAPEHTGNAPYVAGLAEHLSREHDVTVVAAPPHYPQWRVAPEWRQWRSVVRDGRLLVVRLRQYVPSRQDFVRRFLYELTWAVRAWIEGRRHKADVVLGVTPTLLTTHVARRIARRHKAKMALMVQDVVSRAAAQSGIKGGRGAAGVTAALEGSGLRAADGICTIHPRFASVLSTEFAIDDSKIEVIYNWSHIALPTGERDEVRRRHGWADDEIVVLHSGNMGNKQYLDSVVAAARLASSRGERVRFVLAGDGNQRERLAGLGAGVPALEIRPAVANSEFPDFLAAADILLVNERPDVFEMSVPSKLTSYLAAGRPVVAATEAQSATGELVAASGGGIVVPPGDPEALLDSVVELAADGALMDSLGKTGQDFAATQLSSSAALGAYQQWLESLVDD